MTHEKTEFTSLSSLGPRYLLPPQAREPYPGAEAAKGLGPLCHPCLSVL